MPNQNETAAQLHDRKFQERLKKLEVEKRKKRLEDMKYQRVL